MAAYPLGLKAYKRTDGFVPEVRCFNMYTEKDESGVSPDGVMRIQRPGMLLSYTLSGVIRGLEYRVATDETLSVAGGSFFSGQVNKGTVSGSDRVAFASTTFATVTAAQGALYYYDGSLSTVSLPDGYIAQDVDQLNQYVLVLTPSGRFYWIVPGEDTIDPLNFATAESSADRGVAIRRIGDEFWILGTDTIEPWQSTGDEDAPFQRINGRIYERGCLSRDSARRFDNTLMWVSSDLQVCRGGAVPEVVSDAALSERLRLRNGDPYAWTFRLDGHEFYVLNIPGQGTFAYDALTQNWCEFGSIGKTGWKVLTGYDQAGQITVGDSTSGAVYVLDPERGNDNGEIIERIITGTLGFMGKAGRNDSLSIGVGCSEDCTVRLRWKDGQEDYPSQYEEMEVRAPLDVATMRRLGIPLQPYRTIEVSCVDPARIRIAGCTANESFGR